VAAAGQIKVVGRRKVPEGIMAAENLFQTLLKLRGTQRFVPRGVYRFKTHEEANQWLMKMLTR